MEERWRGAYKAANILCWIMGFLIVVCVVGPFAAGALRESAAGMFLRLALVFCYSGLLISVFLFPFLMLVLGIIVAAQGAAWRGVSLILTGIFLEIPAVLIWVFLGAMATRQ